MSRTFTAIAFTAALGAALPTNAQSVSITIEGDATITIEQADPSMVVQHPKPHHAHPIKPRHPGWMHKPNHNDWRHDPGHWMEHNADVQQQHAPSAPAHAPQPTQQMERAPTNVEQGTIGRAFDGNGPQTIDTIVVTTLPDRPVCDAKALESLVGSAIPSGSELAGMELGNTVRVLEAGQPYTLDKRSDRATIVVDSKDFVQDAYCG